MAIIKKKMQQAQEPKKPAPSKEPEDVNSVKMIDYYLYEFDVTQSYDQNSQEKNEGNQQLVQELFESFNGYFTLPECYKALVINHDDMMSAGQWLAEEGETERTKRSYQVRNKTLLFQHMITSEINLKTLKNINDIQIDDNTILNTNQIQQFLWTMNDTQLALYTDQGVRIFSKNPADVHNLTQQIEANVELLKQTQENFTTIGKPALHSKTSTGLFKYINKQEEDDQTELELRKLAEHRCMICGETEHSTDGCPSYDTSNKWVLILEKLEEPYYNKLMTYSLKSAKTINDSLFQKALQKLYEDVTPLPFPLPLPSSLCPLPSSLCHSGTAFKQVRWRVPSSTHQSLGALRAVPGAAAGRAPNLHLNALRRHN